jgi:hypothetical protein
VAGDVQPGIFIIAFGFVFEKIMIAIPLKIWYSMFIISQTRVPVEVSRCP